MQCFCFWYLKRSAALGSVSESMGVSLVALVTYIPALYGTILFSLYRNELKITVFAVALAENEFSSMGGPSIFELLRQNKLIT